MAYSRPTFEVQGVTFKLKPTSPRNVKNLQDFVEESDIEEEADDSAQIEQLADQYMDVLELIAEPQDGTFGDVDKMDLDINLVDAYLRDFMPIGTAT